MPDPEHDGHAASSKAATVEVRSVHVASRLHVYMECFYYMSSKVYPKDYLPRRSY